MSNKSAAKALHDKRTDIRAFVIARLSGHGLLLLRANKKKKGLHYQLPGGHVDRDELEELGAARASKVAAARELFEETGIDVRKSLHRLDYFPAEVSKANRYFFVMDLVLQDAVGKTLADQPVGASAESGESKQTIGDQSFTLKLSHEHTGFYFEPDLNVAAEQLIQHSGGACSEAVRIMALMLERFSSRQRTDTNKKHLSFLSVDELVSGGASKSSSGNSKVHFFGGGHGLTKAEQIALDSFKDDQDDIMSHRKSHAVSSDCCGFSCFKEVNIGAVKVDPKTYFANERTFLNWIHTAATLGSFGILTYNLSNSESIKEDAQAYVKITGMSMIASAMVMILYALFTFNMRSKLVRQRADGPYGMPVGPLASSVVLVGMFVALVAVSVKDFL